MPTIDFYILENENKMQCWQFACRLLEKAYQKNHRVYVHLQDHSDAKRFDDLLWTFSDTSFIPHALQGEKDEVPIQLGYTETLEEASDVLLNLSETFPVFFKQFARVLEIVGKDENQKLKARENFRRYKTEGFNITTHKI